MINEIITVQTAREKVDGDKNDGKVFQKEKFLRKSAKISTDYFNHHSKEIFPNFFKKETTKKII